MQLVVQPMIFPTTPSPQAKIAIHPLCSQSSPSTLLLGAQRSLELLLHLSLSLAGELLKGHKERCLTNLGTPKGLARPGFKTGVLVTESSHGPHIVCSIQYILLFVSLFLLLSTFHVPEISELPNFLLHYLPE